MSTVTPALVTVTTPSDVSARLAELEERTCTRDNILARWEFGLYMLTFKQGKQLPRDVVAKHCARYKVGKSELA